VACLRVQDLRHPPLHDPLPVRAGLGVVDREDLRSLEYLGQESRWNEAADPQLDVVAYSAPLRAHTLTGATRRGPATGYIGIDLHKKESQICLLTETGEVMERRIRTEPQRFAEMLGGRPRARILVEPTFRRSRRSYRATA
jgi:hypothetical protein